MFGQSPAVFRRVEAGLTFRRRPKPPQTRPKPDLWRPPKTPGGFESRSPPFYLRQIAPFLLHRGRTFLKGQTNVGVVTITWQDLGLLLRYVDVREGWPSTRLAPSCWATRSGSPCYSRSRASTRTR